MYAQSTISAVLLDTGHLGAPAAMHPVNGKIFLEWLIHEVRRQISGPIFVITDKKNGYIQQNFYEKYGIDIINIAPSLNGIYDEISILKSVSMDLQAHFILHTSYLFDINLWDLACHVGDKNIALALSPEQVPDHKHDSKGRLPHLPSSQRGKVAFVPSGFWAQKSYEEAQGPLSLLYRQLALQGRLLGRVYRRPLIMADSGNDSTAVERTLPSLLARGAVIFDRDGVLNQDIGYAYRPDQILWTTDAIAAIKYVNDAGLLAMVATNQSGVARGLYSEHDVQTLHRWMIDELRRHGANIDAIAYCPFHPEGVIEAYRRNSPLRKPAPGMIHELIARSGADAARCVMIGDQPSDLAAAQAAGIAGIHFQGGSLLAQIKPIVDRLKTPLSPYNEGERNA